MNKHTNQVNVRLTDEEVRALSALRRNHDPIPSASDVMRKALRRMYEQDVKTNGHGGRGRNGK